MTVYVLADDDKYYKDPILEGDDWYICFAIDDPPELVIKLSSNHDAFTINNITGIEFEPHGRLRKSGSRYFQGKFHPAKQVFGRIRSPIPVAWLKNRTGGLEKIPSCDCVIHSFGREIPR